MRNDFKLYSYKLSQVSARPIDSHRKGTDVQKQEDAVYIGH